MSRLFVNYYFCSLDSTATHHSCCPFSFLEFKFKSLSFYNFFETCPFWLLWILCKQQLWQNHFSSSSALIREKTNFPLGWLWVITASLLLSLWRPIPISGSASPGLQMFPQAFLCLSHFRPLPENVLPVPGNHYYRCCLIFYTTFKSLWKHRTIILGFLLLFLFLG